MNVGFDVLGVKEVAKAMEGLSDVAKRGVQRQALRFAATPLNKEIKRAARDVGDEGHLSKSIKISKVEILRGGGFRIRVGPDPNFIVTGRDGRKKRPSQYAHLVEFGTKSHSQPNHPIYSNIMHPGAKAKPFMRPGASRAEAMVVARYQQKIFSAVERRWASGRT